MSNFLQDFKCDSKYLLLENASTFKIADILGLITALIAIIPICGFLSIPVDKVYYGILIVNFLFLLKDSSGKYNGAFIIFYIILLVNVLIIDIPDFFKPIQRLVLFILMTITTSSVIKSYKAVQLRQSIFKYTIWGLSILSIGSFFCFFLGINMMSRRSLEMSSIEAYSSNGGWFGGLVSHSMMLGPISMLVSIFFLTLFVERNRKIYLILFFMATMSAMFASSRAALLGIASAIVYSLVFGKFNKKIKKKLIGILLLCGIMFLPFSGIALRGVIDKQQKRNIQNSSINSRQDKFDFRIEEFKSSPLLGVGFCAIDINSGDAYGTEDGRIEPGTSHLSVLSMTGLLGMLVYLVILYQAYKNARHSQSVHSRFAILCFVALFVHAWFEGYIFSAGGFLAFIYWLVIGQCIDCKKDVVPSTINAS